MRFTHYADCLWANVIKLNCSKLGRKFSTTFSGVKTHGIRVTIPWHWGLKYCRFRVESQLYKILQYYPRMEVYYSSKLFYHIDSFSQNIYGKKST
jgi:hypothetical protein